MKKLKELIVNKVVKRKHKYIGVNVIGVPLYSDQFRLANKETKFINRNEKYVAINIEKQDNQAIEIKRSIRNHNGNPDFEVDGVKQGDVYKTSGRGFLGNITTVEEVILVTNNFVFTKELDDNSTRCHSHEEIARMKQARAFELVEKNSLKNQLAS